MDSMQDTILQYEQSCAALQARLSLLNDKIYMRAPLEQYETVHTLLQRRHCLYLEITEMEETLFHLRQYVTD